MSRATTGRSARAAARDAGADYVAIGSVFPSATKPAAVRAPLEAIELARRAGGLPVAAIGGITPANASAVIAAGADMVAVISALFEAPDVRAAAESLSRLFDPHEDPAMYERSRALFERSLQVIPGGVNSPVRAFRAVGGVPVFLREGRGARVIDEDDREYIDYVGSWGPLILGHAHPDVLAAVTKSAARGLSFGAPTALELEMAELLTASLPSLEQVRLVSSGTEAVMSALRLARGFTGRAIIVKFEGCYHGHSDSLLVKAGSGALTFGNPTSAGVPAELTSHTLVLDYNDPQQVEDAFRRFGDEIAAVVIEPVAGNMNFVRPAPEFLRGLRAACTTPWRGPHLRRGDDGISRGSPGRAGRLRHPPGSHDAGQGDRRRHARGRVRRAPRHHGDASLPWAPCTRRARCREIPLP